MIKMSVREFAAKKRSLWFNVPAGNRYIHVLFVMAQDDRGHIWHIAVTNFNIVLAAYLVKPVMFRKMLCN